MTLTKNEQEVRKSTDWMFAKHIIQERSRNGLYRSWRCRSTENGFCWFDITTIPGSIFVTGDIGDLIVSCTDDMLGWCKSAVDSTGYFASKVPHGFETKRFSWEVFKAWAEAEIADEEISKEDRETIEDLIDYGDEHGESHFYEELSEYCGGEYPNWTDWTHNFLRCRDAIRWFVMNHVEPANEGATQ